MTTPLQSIPLKTITGDDTDLGAYAGKVLLIVNVASKCGLTPQYEGLEKLYEQYRDRGLVVLGFPANDFGAQEPGSNEEIQTFCQTNYNVQFPMFAKIAVTGEQQHPLYSALIAAQPRATNKPDSDFRAKLASYGIQPKHESDVLWNFEKFLVNRKGEVVARFAPDITPNDPLIVEAVERELAA